MQEIIDRLKVHTDGNYCRFRYKNIPMFFTRNDREGYWINRNENKYYGLVVTDDGTIIHGYPHLWNLKNDTELALPNSILELKENGTCIAISSYNGKPNIRTRMSPFPTEFPIPPFWNETIDEMIHDDMKKMILSLRTEMLSKYPQWYVYEADGEYVGLKVQEVVRSIIDVDKLTSSNPNLVFYFELIGKINPIIIDSDAKYGLYDFDYDLMLFDVYEKELGVFLGRTAKELLAQYCGLKIVPVLYDFSNNEELRSALPKIKQDAEDRLIEGYVLKNGVDIFKVKSEVVLMSAYRLLAIERGFIAFPDMLNYISKVVTAEHLKQPDKFSELVELVSIEALADYPEDIAKGTKNKNAIRKYIAHHMAVMVATEILKEKVFTTPDELYRYLNLEIPERFSPLKEYIDFKLEKTTEDRRLREQMKRRRKQLFERVSRHCMKTLNIDRGTYS